MLLFTLFITISSLFTFAYYTNTNKFLEEQKEPYVDGFGQKRLAEDFIDNGCGIGTMLDTVTGLCWDKDMNHNGSALQWSTDTAYTEPIWDDITKVYSYPAGKASYLAFSYCEDLIIDGKDDFRLPTVNELMTLIDEIGPMGTTCSTLVGFGFINCQARFYLPSTECVSSTLFIEAVHFRDGYEFVNAKTTASSVLCVS